MTFKDTMYGDLTGHKTFDSINISKQKIDSLEGAPIECYGDFFCEHNNLKTLEHSPNRVFGVFGCGRNPIISLKGSPAQVGGDYDCSGTKVKSFEGCTTDIGGTFYAYDVPMTEDEMIDDIINYQIKAKDYSIRESYYTFEDIKERFIAHQKMKSVKSKGFRTLLGLKK